MKHFLLTISIVCLLLVGYTTVNGAEWVYYGKSANGLWYYDKESIDLDGKGTLKVWDKLIYTEKGKKDYIEKSKKGGYYKMEFKDLSYSLLLNVIKCSTKEHRITSMSHNDGEGGIIVSHSNPSTPYGPIPPEGTIETLYNIVCKAEKK